MDSQLNLRCGCAQFIVVPSVATIYFDVFNYCVVIHRIIVDTHKYNSNYYIYANKQGSKVWTTNAKVTEA